MWSLITLGAPPTRPGTSQQSPTIVKTCPTMSTFRPQEIGEALCVVCAVASGHFFHQKSILALEMVPQSGNRNLAEIRQKFEIRS